MVLKSVRAQHSKPTPVGAPFYIASRYQTFGVLELHCSGKGVNRSFPQLEQPISVSRIGIHLRFDPGPGIVEESQTC